MIRTILHMVRKPFMSGATHLIGFLAMMCVSLTSVAQDTINTQIPLAQLRRNRLAVTITDTLTGDSTIRTTQLVLPSEKAIRQLIDEKRFIPDPKKALWLAIAIPGGGQIYNRKYWKLPLIYGGFLGCIYALNWNNTKKNYYRRYRDLSMFIMIGVYALSIIDAYVDAELSSFDISKNLSMKVRPSFIHDKNTTVWNKTLTPHSYGVECSINF